MPGINLAGGYAAGGVHDALLEIVKQRMLEQELAQRAEQAQYDRMRQNRADARAEDETKYQRGRDVLGDTRQAELDKQAAETRTQQNEIGRYNILKGQPAADIKASLGEDLSTGQTVPTTPNPAIPGNAPAYLIGQNTRANPMLINGTRIRPPSMEDLDQAAAIDKEREIQGQIRVAQAKPGNRSSVSGYIGPQGEPVQTDESGHFYIGTQEVPVSQVRRAPPQGDPNAQGARDDARMDRSYVFNVGELRDLRKPIADRAERLGRLVLTVNEQSPQADAVIAPELITVMAGGQGSGVRITTGEIQAALGGRSNLESVKAALNKWQLDPSKALSVTPAQREQIRSLIGVIHQRVSDQLSTINEGLARMNEAGSVEEHRRIVQETQKKYDALSGGGGSVDVNSIINDVLSKRPIKK